MSKKRRNKNWFKVDMWLLSLKKWAPSRYSLHSFYSRVRTSINSNFMLWLIGKNWGSTNGKSHHKSINARWHETAIAIFSTKSNKQIFQVVMNRQRKNIHDSQIKLNYIPYLSLISITMHCISPQFFPHETCGDF